MTKCNIVLIGPPGSGKTTLGAAFAQRTGRLFVDLDEWITHSAGTGIPDIFARHGEPYFRTLESEAAAHAAQTSGAVIATGGGIVTVAANMKTLCATGTVVYLRCRLETLRKRTQGDTNRPLLAAPGALEKLLTAREPLYKQYADVTLDTDDVDTDALTDQLEGIYGALRRDPRPELEHAGYA